MSSINQVILAGRAGKDAEVRTFQDGNKIAEFTLATSRGGYTSKDGREIPEVTQWHNISCRRHLAELCERAVRKGTPVTVVGEINYRKYTGKDGVERTVTDIVATSLFIPVPTATQPAPQPQLAEYQKSPSYQPYPQPEKATGSDTLPF